MHAAPFADAPTVTLAVTPALTPAVAQPPHTQPTAASSGVQGKAQPRVASAPNTTHASKSPRKPRTVLHTPTQPEATPTPERLVRSDFTGTHPMRVLRTVQGLLNAGDITQPAADAAERWYRDYVFGYCDYKEFLQTAPKASITRHDAVSWQMMRGKAMARITAVRNALGLCAHQRLRMLLVDELSFRAMGAALFPALSASSAQRKIAAQCALLLEQLEAFEDAARKAAKQARAAHTADPLQNPSAPPTVV